MRNAPKAFIGASVLFFIIGCMSFIIGPENSCGCEPGTDMNMHGMIGVICMIGTVVSIIMTSIADMNEW